MTTTMNRDELDRIITRVRALLAKAEATPFPEERATYSAKAEALMFKYRIAEAQLAEAQPSLGLVPIKVEWDAYTNSLKDEDRQVLRNVISYILSHTGCRGIWLGYRGDWSSQERVSVLRVYGWESDIRYAEELYLSVKAAYLGRMAPSVDPSKSDDENAFRLRMAGVERNRISVMLGWGNRHGDHARVTHAVKRWAEEHDVPADELAAVLGRGNSMKIWRAAFRKSFGDRLWDNLSAARSAVEHTGGGLVPVSREQAVNELFYEDFPQYRPTKGVALTEWCDDCVRCERHKSDKVAYGLPKPNKYEREMGYRSCNCKPCRYHKWAHQNRSDAENAAKLDNSPGAMAGRSAADRVDIRREGSRVNRIGD